MSRQTPPDPRRSEPHLEGGQTPSNGSQEPRRGGIVGNAAGEFFMDVYQHMPSMVLHLSIDGVVLRCNPAVTRVTGYAEEELLGRNVWGLLFPGRLFAQVPKFISSVGGAHVGEVLGNDVVMTIRAKDGKERVVGWTRFVHDGGEKGKTLVCLGNDLTDRLIAADREGSEFSEVGVGDCGTVEGDVVMPIAITPPRASDTAGATAEAIEKVHGFLMEIEGLATALESAYSRGEMRMLARVAADLREGSHACGLLDFSARLEQLHLAATMGAAGKVEGLVREVVGMCKGSGGVIGNS